MYYYRLCIQSQKISEQLYLKLDSEAHTKYMVEHKEIIDHFGHFPYRHAVMNRPSTSEELDYINGNNLDFTKV